MAMVATAGITISTTCELSSIPLSPKYNIKMSNLCAQRVTGGSMELRTQSIMEFFPSLSTTYDKFTNTQSGGGGGGFGLPVMPQGYWWCTLAKVGMGC